MASSGLLNIDPEKQADPFYRYKMPRIMTKVEGNGNGIKTVISNIEQICERIYRKSEYPMKYFGHDLAVTSKFKDDKWILTGSFSQEKVQSSLFDFIKKFVLCKACRNPETVIVVDDKGDVYLSCKACSRVTPVDPKEKLTNLLSKSEKASKTEGGKPSEKKKKKDKSKDEKEEEKYDAQTRQVKDSDTITVSECPKADLPNPIEVLKEFIRSEPAPKESEIAGKVFDMRGDYGLDDKGVVCLVFESLYDADIVKQIPKTYKIMKRFIKPETEKDLIVNCMSLCAEEASIKPKFPIILKTFYDHNVLSEEAILTWHTGKNTKAVDKAAQLYFKEKSQPLIDWLKEEDDDDDDEDEEDEEDEKPKQSQQQANGATNGTKTSAKEEEDDDDVDIDNI